MVVVLFLGQLLILGQVLSLGQVWPWSSWHGSRCSLVKLTRFKFDLGQVDMGQVRLGSKLVWVKLWRVKFGLGQVVVFPYKRCLDYISTTAVPTRRPTNHHSRYTTRSVVDNMVPNFITRAPVPNTIIGSSDSWFDYAINRMREIATNDLSSSHSPSTLNASDSITLIG